MSAEPQVLHAIRAVRIGIDRKAREQYLNQMKAFAETFGFTTRLSQTSPDPNDIVVHMERNGIQIVSGMASRFGGPDLAYKVFFYAASDRQVSSSSFDSLVADLKRFLGQVEGAVITESALRG